MYGWGGISTIRVGGKNDPERLAWKRRRGSGDHADEEVPEHLKHVRLRRRTRSRMSSTPLTTWIVIVAVIASAFVLALRPLFNF